MNSLHLGVELDIHIVEHEEGFFSITNTQKSVVVVLKSDMEYCFLIYRQPYNVYLLLNRSCKLVLKTRVFSKFA